MMDSKLVILDLQSIDTCRILIGEMGWEWAFMGTNSCLREKILNQLGSDSRYCYAEEFQDVCIGEKKTFLDWLAQIGKRQDGHLWWATNIAYKSPYTSDLFLNYCYLMLIQRWVKQDVKNRVIIIENPWLIKTCSINFNNKSIHIIKKHKYFLISWIKLRAFSYARLFWFLARSIIIWTVNKIYSQRYRKHIEKILKNKIDIISCTWIEDRSFKGNNFHDPYLGSLTDYCSTRGLKDVTITLPILPFHLLKKAYQCKKIIPSIYFAKLSDILKSFFKSLFLKLNIELPDSNGLNLKPIFEYESIQENGRFCYSYLHYLITINIFTNIILCNLLIYPFENQPWDKMMVIGLREIQSRCKIVACHNIGVPFFYLNFFLGENENNIHPQPDVIVSNGEYWGKVLENAGFSCEIKNGGSLRYSSNIKINIAEVLLNKEERDNNVLVLLSTSLGYSLDLLFYLLRSPLTDKKFLLKPHPDTPEKVIRKFISKLPENFVFIGGSLDECIKQVGWAIHAGTTAAIECMIHGIIVFKYLPERIDLDPLLNLDFKQHIITDKDVLDFNNKSAFNIPDNNLIAEPFNEATWKDILK